MKAKDDTLMYNSIDRIQLFDFQEKGDERGHLVFVEGGIDIPFSIERFFWFR